MQALNVEAVDLAALALEGLVLGHDVEAGAGQSGRAFRKGDRLAAGDGPALLASGRRRFHLVRLAADDVGEAAAGDRLARALVGPGVSIRPSGQGRQNLVAAHRGLLRVDVDRLARLNAVAGVAVFSLFDRQVVDTGEVVAGAKIAPLAVPEAALVAAEAAAAPGAVLRVSPFRPVRIETLYREKLVESRRDRFVEAIQTKAAWLGSTAGTPLPVEDDPPAIAALLRRFVAAGAGLIFAAGGSSIDPLDETIQALELAGARMVKHGVAAHPGSMFWLADLGGVPILSLASCSLFSSATVVDLVLPRLLAGETVDAAALAAFGHGGLLERGMEWRFPAYALTKARDS